LRKNYRADIHEKRSFAKLRHATFYFEKKLGSWNCGRLSISKSRHQRATH
jgi:hypothetical protein